jgi:excisionase family DNA binding protein
MVVQAAGLAGPQVRAASDAGDRLMNVRQVAERLGVSTATVYALVERGVLAHVRVSNAIRVTEGDLAVFVATATCTP